MTKPPLPEESSANSSQLSPVPDPSIGSPRGSARPGAGRPKGQGRWGEPTTSVRVPLSQVGVVKNWLADLAEGHPSMHQAECLPDADHLAAAGMTLLRPQKITALLPLVLYSGRIAAGFPSPADDYADERIDLNHHLIVSVQPSHLF